MFRAHYFIILVLFSISAFAEGNVDITVIQAGQLLVPETGKLLKDQRNLIEDGVIKAVGHDIAIPANAVVIDLKDSIVMPGLMDAHTHLCWHYNANSSLLYKNQRRFERFKG